MRRVNQPPILGPYATKYQIDQTVFKDNKYRRYEIEIADDEEKTAETPIKIILLKSMEGKLTYNNKQKFHPYICNKFECV